MECGSNASAHLKRWVPTKDEWLMGLGLGLYMAWVDCVFHGSQVINIAGDGFSALEANRAVYLVSITTLCAMLLLCAVFHRKVDPYIYRHKTIVMAPVGMAAATLALLGISLGGTARWAFIAFAGVTTAISSALCLLHWGALSTSMSVREIVVTAVMGYVLSDLFAALFQGLATLKAVPAHLLLTLLIALCALFALTSGSILIWATSRESSQPLAFAGLGEDASAAQDDTQRSRRIVWRLALSIVVLGFISSTSRDLSFAFGGQEGYVGGNPIVYVRLACIGLVGGLVICAAFFSKDTQRNVGLCYRALILLALVGVSFMPSIAFFGKVSLGVSSALSMGTSKVLYILMWITTAGICRRFRSRTTEYFATVRMCWALGPLLGYFFCLIFAHDGVSGTLLYVWHTISTVGLFAAYAFVLTEHALGEALSLIPRKYRKPFKERCAVVARTYGLTERELEVMMFFAKGRDSAFIQKELCLSKSTVSTHRQHIYAKLEVHSQQELLNKLFELENAGQ